jgi:ribonuclease E
MELSRQRLRPSLGESTHMACPRCSGMGTIRSVESMALALLRLIGEEARKDRTSRVVAQLPVDVATFLINEKREWLNQLESRSTTDIVLVPDPNMQTPNYSIRRVREDELVLPENAVTSYQMAGQPAVEIDFKTEAEKHPAPAPPAVQTIAPAAPAPTPVAAPRKVAAGPGFWSRLIDLFRGSGTQAAEVAAPASGNAQRHHESRDTRHSRDLGTERGGHRRDRGDHRQRADNRHHKDRDPDRDRDRNNDRNRNRDRHRGQQADQHGDRNRQDSQRRDVERTQDRPGDARPQAPTSAPGQAEQASTESDMRRRRRRRRGRGGNRDTRQGQQGPADASPPTQDHYDAPVPDSQKDFPAQPPEQRVGQDAAGSPPPAMPAESPTGLPPAQQAAPVSAEQRPSQTFTVWSSTPGEGHHFGPKE